MLYLLHSSLQEGSSWVNHSKMFVCEECIFVFQAHSVLTNHTRKPYCPNCGDNFEVRQYQADRMVKRKKGQKLVKPPWTPSELALLDCIIAGELLPHQVAIKIGRSINSVNKRLTRRVKQLTKEKVSESSKQAINK